MNQFLAHAIALGLKPRLNDNLGSAIFEFPNNDVMQTITCTHEIYDNEVKFTYTFNDVSDTITIPYGRFQELTKENIDATLAVMIDAMLRAREHKIAIQNIQIDLYIHLFRHLDPAEAELLTLMQRGKTELNVTC